MLLHLTHAMRRDNVQDSPTDGPPMQLRSFAITLVSLFLVLQATHSPAAPKLSGAERRLVAAAQAENQRTFELLEKLVDINSGTMNPKGVREVGDVMRAELEEI